MLLSFPKKKKKKTDPSEHFSNPVWPFPKQGQSYYFFHFPKPGNISSRNQTLAHRLVPYKTVEGRKLNLTSILFSFTKKVEKQTMTGPK
jgi:hypothetical protein